MTVSPPPTAQFAHALARLATLLLMAVPLALSWPPASAQAPQEPADETCTSCHSDIAEAWLASPHGTVPPDSHGEPGGASCVDCHGEYVKGHPAEGLIPLTVDSAQCRECHTETYSEWQGTLHAQDGVQCISCHKPHSQELRLTDEALCQSCHHESLADPLHTAHWQSNTTCTSCHLAGSSDMNLLASAGSAAGLPVAPRHDFVTVSADNCLECHRNDTQRATAYDLPASPASPATPQIAAELEQTRHTNQVLRTLSAANIGIGMGVGGLLGIGFMLVIASRIQGRR
ncbi:MAG TPA: cytochrome c3 family protein [Caldilineaceae bacterium]|nr:cytochrome c3 family protein [Caldilineaceae bacterium]